MKRVLQLTLFIALMLVVTGCGTAGLSVPITPKPTSTSTIPTPAPTPFPTATPFGADWKIYNLPGLLLKLPPEWEAKTSLDQIQAGPSPLGTKQPDLQITAYVGQPLIQDTTKVRSTTVNVAGVQGVALWDLNGPCLTLYVSVDATHYYSFLSQTLLCEGEVGKEKLSSIAEGILSLVSFTPSHWELTSVKPASQLGQTKTYIDEIVGYAIDYPNTWYIFGDPGGTVILQSFKPENGGTEGVSPNAAKIDLAADQIQAKTLKEFTTLFKKQLADVGEAVVKEDNIQLANKLSAVHLQSSSAFGKSNYYLCVINGHSLMLAGFGNAKMISYVAATLRQLGPVAGTTP